MDSLSRSAAGNRACQPEKRQDPGDDVWSALRVYKLDVYMSYFLDIKSLTGLFFEEPKH